MIREQLENRWPCRRIVVDFKRGPSTCWGLRISDFRLPDFELVGAGNHEAFYSKDDVSARCKNGNFSYQWRNYVKKWHLGERVSWTGGGTSRTEVETQEIEGFSSSNASFPDNWTQATNPCNAKDSETIFHLGEAEVNTFIQNFLVEKQDLFRCGIFNQIWSFVIAGLFGLFGRRMLGKFFVADAHCTGCAFARNLSGSEHPNGSEKPVWKSRCEDCNRCINVCPEKALQVSIPLMVVHLVLNLGLTTWAIVEIVRRVPEWIQLPDLWMIGLKPSSSLKRSRC